MVREAEIPQFKCKANEVGDEIGGMDAAVDKDSPVDIGVGECGKGRGLGRESAYVYMRGCCRGTYLQGDELVVDTANIQYAHSVP